MKLSVQFLLILGLVMLTATRASAVDFDTEIMPVLTKAGCNAGACHGAAAGRGGFKLSLFGGDPAADYDAIVRALEGRRINHHDPLASLLVKKPTGELDHEGGVRFDPESPQAALLVQWIKSGARRQQLRKLVEIKASPPRIVARGPDQALPLRVVASFDDDTNKDVTGLAVYEPADPAAVTVGETGLVRVLRRGRHTVAVRFLSQVTTVEVIVPLVCGGVDVSRQKSNNWVDDELLSLWKLLHIDPARPADDATLLRRAYLDLTGRLPAPGEVTAYLANEDEAKFQNLVDRLLASDEFNEFWTFRFAKLLRIRAPGNDSAAALAFHTWLRKQIEQQTPWNKVAARLLQAEGDSHEYGPANFFRLARSPREQAEYVSETLMGVKLRCANCHNHPLDRWTQDDYHGLAAVFARIGRGRVVRVLPRGEVSNPRTGEPAVPRIPGQRYLDDAPDPRREFATWLTTPDNPYFSRATVNRLWKWLMGSGLVEPADDLRETNPAVLPPLLNRLAKDFAQHQFNLRHTIRLIVTSAAYQRARDDTSASSGKYFESAQAKQLEAEVLSDAIADVTGVPDRYGDLPLGTRAIALANPSTPSVTLDLLGRCSRQSSCETSAAVFQGLSTKLHFINGNLINRKLTSPEGRLMRLVQAGRSDLEIVSEFYLIALSRRPSKQELEFWRTQFPGGLDPSKRQQQLEDFLWSLLSSREFTTNR